MSSDEKEPVTDEVPAEKDAATDKSEEIATLKWQLNDTRSSRGTWRGFAIALLLLIAMIAASFPLGILQLESAPLPNSTASQQPFNLQDVQFKPADGMVPLMPPSSADVAAFESFVHNAVLEASRLYADYLRASGVPGEGPAVYSVSIASRDAHPTLCLAEDIASDHPYAFFCADDKAVWIPQATLLGTFAPKNIGIKEGEIYSPTLLRPRRACMPTARQSLTVWQNRATLHRFTGSTMTSWQHALPAFGWAPAAGCSRQTGGQWLAQLWVTPSLACCATRRKSWTMLLGWLF